MKEIVLVDSQAARVRRFREAVALYQHTFLPLQKETARARARLRERMERTRSARNALRLSRESMARQVEAVRLRVFPSGSEAMKFLRREPPYEWALRPAVVFTDLYLEGTGGAAFVARLKADPALRTLPAVVLSHGNASADDVRAAWRAGSNAVVELALGGEDAHRRVADALSFWVSDAATPH